MRVTGRVLLVFAIILASPFAHAENISEPIAPQENALHVTTPAISTSKTVEQEKQIQNASALHGKILLESCPQNWEDAYCLKGISDTFLTLTALYAEDLHKSTHKLEIIAIKNHCAASTAATRMDNIPFYALRSAFTECVNEVYDISERTGLKPNIDLYQLAVLSVLCLDKDTRCESMENGLRKKINP